MISLISDALKVLGVIPVKVHRHAPPRCGDDGQDKPDGHGGIQKYHDPGCADRGPELICRVIGKGRLKFCLCTHLKL